ncbi:MAG: hypothetical protein AAFR87_27715 [Bacteroidota bacterium]
MDAYQKNRNTFQNLCVLAFIDGGLHEEERNLLVSLADSMGLEAEEALRILETAGRLEVKIPVSQEDRLMDLQMLVLLMLSDGKIDEREYALCVLLCNKMNIERSYLDDLLNIQVEKHHVHTHHLSIFQNLYLVAAADGKIEDSEHDLLLEVAYNLGLYQEDIDFVIGNYPDLQLVIPTDKEERIYTLRNLVYMMIVDGIVDEKEYNLCIEFAEKSGLGGGEVEKIIEEYEQLREERLAEMPEIEAFNLDVYLDVFNSLDKSGIAAEVLIDRLESSMSAHKPDKSLDLGDEGNRSYYEFLWLILVRCMTLNRESTLKLPVFLDKARRENEMQSLKNHLIEIERQHGATRIPLQEMSLDEIIDDLAQVLK